MKSNHRSSSLSKRPWIMSQTWHQLLFVHWPVDAAILRRYIPEPLDLDTYDGCAWLSMAVFYVTGARPRLFPAVTPLSRFFELNVRTYVTYGDLPGVYFFRLDVSKLPVVMGARAFFYLPYYFSKIDVNDTGNGVAYACRHNEDAKVFQVRYRPVSDVFYAVPGTLTYWLSERYCLYTRHKHYLYRCDILHDPWPLQQAEAEIMQNTMVDFVDLQVSESPHLYYAGEQTAVMWGLRKVAYIF